MNGMRVMVTSGHGDVGSHILRQLGDQGHEAVALDVAEPVGPDRVAVETV